MIRPKKRPLSRILVYGSAGSGHINRHIFFVEAGYAGQLRV